MINLIRETFKISKVGTIAGCMVTSGKIFRNSNIRIILLTCVGFMCYFGLALAVFWIPNSPFIYLGCAMVMLHVTSFYAHTKYK